MTTTPRDWDAGTYHRIADAIERWGERVLDRLLLRGDETVMDAGCGSGRVTRLLLDRLPRGRVYGVDRSPAMLSVARETLAAYGDRVTLVAGDLAAVSLPEPVDAVFSNATFHWITDHDALFRNLAATLRFGGALSAQCGGATNTDRVRRLADRALARQPFGRHASRAAEQWNFATPEATHTRLQAAGFTSVETWLEPQPVTFPTAGAFATYLKTVVMGPYLSVLPEPLHDAFVEAVVEEDARDGAERTVDYVRLNMAARRA